MSGIQAGATRGGLRAGSLIGSSALLLLLVWLVVYPLLLVLVEGVREPAGWTLEHVREFAARRTEWQALRGSLVVSLATVMLAALIGIPLAALLALFDFPGRRILSAVVALPAVLPPLVGVVAFLFLYGETGFIARAVQMALGLEEPPWRLEGAAAILLVHAYSMYVYFYLLVRAALLSLDAAQLEAAASLGASRARMLRRVVLPALRPALAGATLLTFMTALASFSAPYVFGGGYRVMPTQIVATRLNGEESLAMVETVSLTLLALLALALFRDADREPMRGGGKGTGPALRRVDRPLARGALALAGWGLAAVLLLPHITLLVVSLVPVGTWTTEAIPPAWTLRNYVTLVSDPVRLRPLLNSIGLAAAATTASLAVAVAAGALVVRARAPGRRGIELLLGLPWAVPGTVFAIALATAFSVRDPSTGRWILVGTVWILPLAYLIRSLPLTSRATLAGFRRLDPSLDEAAASLGAGRWRTLATVTLPLVRPSLVAGGTLAFVTALGDFVTSIVLYTYDTRPISLEILSSLRQADVGVAAAYGVVLMVLSGLVFAVAADRQGTGPT